jgi:hypothetical protein
MRKRIWTGVFTAMVACATVAITAQQPPPEPSKSASADKKITVTGCLKEAPPTSPATSETGAASTAGTTGTAGTAGATGTAGTADAPKFVLTNAVPSTADASGAAPPSEPAPGAAKASETQTYRLIANATSLSPHVGKKLELTGTIEEKSPSSSAGAEGSMAALRVESGKVVGASCSE